MDDDSKNNFKEKIEDEIDTELTKCVDVLNYIQTLMKIPQLATAMNERFADNLNKLRYLGVEL